MRDRYCWFHGLCTPFARRHYQLLALRTGTRRHHYCGQWFDYSHWNASASTCQIFAGLMPLDSDNLIFLYDKKGGFGRLFYWPRDVFITLIVLILDWLMPKH
jgi:hypothetical protein